MSDSVLPHSDGGSSVSDSIAQMAGGAMLRQAREAQGLHIAALAVALKVPVKKLEALESDRFDLLPDTVFVRALAASVCRALKIDSSPILARLPHTTARQLNTQESGVNVPFRASQGGVGLSFWAQLSKPLLLAIVLLLVGVFVLVFFPALQPLDSGVDPKSEGSTPIFPLSAPQAQVAETSVHPEMAASGQASEVAMSGLTASVGIDPVSTEPAAPAAGAPSTIVPGSGLMTGAVVFKARGSSWVEVVDARGTVQLRKTMSSGETVGASGVMPLSVVVGRADTTDVQVNGQPFDLTRIVKDNIARFEVK